MRPTPRSLRALWAWLTLGLGAVLWPPLLQLWAGVGLGLALCLAVEALALRRLTPPVVSRELSAVLPIGRWAEVRLRISAARGLRGLLTDLHPPEMEVEHLPATLSLTENGWQELGYRLRPTRRGSFTFPAVELLLDGPLGLLQRQLRAPAPAEVKVYPDFRRVSQLALLASDDHQQLMGVHQRRRRGEGTEFFQLREYRPGDAMRQIDWRATSRRRQLISKEYRDEEDQRVVVLLDCGRRMHTRDGELSHFDHALDAVLLLGYVALRQGDSMGLLAFSGEDRWIPPRKGPGALGPLIQGVFDLHSGLAPSDFGEAARRLEARQRRRALVVLVTNLRGEDDDELLAVLPTLRRKHLVMVASLREPLLREITEGEVETQDEALRHLATHELLRARRRSLERLASRGVLTVDVEPAGLAVALVNKYLEVKKSGVL